MKARMHFDTLSFANKLKAAGMDPKLAEAQALALVDAIEDGVATRMDILELKNEFETKLILTKDELIRWMVGLFMTNVTIVGVFIALAQFLAYSK